MPNKRMAALEDRRRRKMAQSAHAFVRGTTERFYQWLASKKATTLPDGPDIWICGDCHLGNIGPVANDQGRVDILMRDFDQATISNPAFDLCRLALSLSVLARSSDLPGIATARILECMLDGYESAFPDISTPAPALPHLLRMKVLDAHRRTWKALARERTEGKTLKLPVGRQFWPISAAEHEALRSLFNAPTMQELVTRVGHRPSKASVCLQDAAFWRKGCSSLGCVRYAALLDVGDKSARGSDLCLIDVKEAGPSLAPARADANLPADHGARIVQAARQLSPHLGERMRSAQMMGKSFAIRELMPQDMKLDIRHLRPDWAAELAAYLGYIVGHAHVGQMEQSVRRSWYAELRHARPKSLGSPTWLWEATVGLLADLEVAYLEHCRMYLIDQSRSRSPRVHG
ncbi:DUF2252 domain-containing protein [Dyella monticola]|uniref:DUF2252 domain-containing protein n=1 Tax=Dyella monticola TaxID=1927958 RepID=A0A370X5H3_9GAMM|nr:DUF2252 family protein [Dyella monticola]RDS83527.1 DUF2252 domain-containing protein [Dyella monticola]